MHHTRLKDLVESVGGRLEGDPDILLSGIAPLESATASHITFLSNPKLRSQVKYTKAAALILTDSDCASIAGDFQGARVITDAPYVYFARAAQYFADKARIPVVPGVHSSANVAPTAKIARSAYIGPFVSVEEEAEIGENCIVEAGSFIGRGAKVGANTHCHARVSLLALCRIGESCIVHSGAVIGADGFGFANEKGKWIKIPQTGRVVIGNDVEIGANTTIDRGALADTVIEDGVKLDNQIQIGHNCHIGAHTAMAGCVGVAGSAKIGKYCTFGGAAMVLGHLTIVDNVHISSGSMVSRSILEPGQYTGFYPLAKNAEWEKSAVIVRNLASMREKIRELEKALKSIGHDKNEQP
jgi:UDP-3-O-[3-hydroxymyristoyl] glucosamine N-acyltransferase